MLPAHCTTLPRQGLARYPSDTPKSGLHHSQSNFSAEILAAVPAGAAVAGSQGAFLRAVDEHPDTVLLRAHGRESLRAVAWVLASTASWSTVTARPTWPVLMERTGRSRSTVSGWLRWLRERGLLGVVESGTTPRFAPMALAQDDANRAAVYVLCVPSQQRWDDSAAALEDAGAGERPVSVDESRTPTFLVFNLEKNPYAGARENRPVAAVAELRHEKRSDERGGGAWGRATVADSRHDRLDLVGRLQAEAPALRPCSPRELRSVLRPWLARPELGWSVAELLYAIDHGPDGRAYPFTAAVRVPARWLAHRMRAWRNENGQALPSPRMAGAAARAAEHAAQEQARAERDERRRGIEDERAFGERVRAAAGARYPALVEAVMAGQPAGVRLLQAAGAEALVRVAVREIAGANAMANGLAAAVNELLARRGRPGT